MRSDIIVEMTEPPSASNTGRLLTTTHRQRHGKGANLNILPNGRSKTKKLSSLLESIQEIDRNPDPEHRIAEYRKLAISQNVPYEQVLHLSAMYLGGRHETL